MNCSRLITTGLLLLLTLAASAAIAAGDVEITRVEGHYLDRLINMVIEWQSTNPVVKARITVGRETREMLVDEYDNRRDPRGYHGTLSLQLPADPQPAIPYTIQLEDDLRQQSAMVNGKITPSSTAGTTQYPTYSQPYGQTYGQTYGQGYGQTYGQTDDNWGRKASSTPTYRTEPGMQAGGSGSMVDRLIQVVDRYDLAPSIDKIKVNVLSPDNVSFATKANDDKGLQEVRFRVYDRKGILIGSQSLNNLGKVWQGSSQTFTIGGGLFRVTAQAVDTAGNTSKEESATFELTGKALELAPLPNSGQSPYGQQQGYPSQPTATGTTQPSTAYPTTQPTYDPYGQATPSYQQPTGSYPATSGTTQSYPYQSPTGTYQDPYQQQPGAYQQSNPYQQQPAGTYQQSNPYQQQPGYPQQPANPYQQPTTPTQPQTSPSTTAPTSWW